MRRNKGLFTGMMLFGAGLAVLSLLLGTGGERRGRHADGSGFRLICHGPCQPSAAPPSGENPRQMKQEEIEANDERNVAIRRRAQAVAGEVLQWSVMAAAWISIGFGAPLW